jgi:putative DNA primase/helicase
MLEDWQDGIGTLAKGEGSLILNISSAPVAPLARITGINAGGINIVDDTSTGKTTVQHAGASVWGRGGKGGLTQPWSGTLNGMEAAAVSFNDTALFLDNGVGKLRMDRTRALQETNKWATFIISSSEQGVEVRLREAGIKVKGGQDVRLLEIPADRGHGVGAFDKPKTKAEASAFADKVEAASKQANGTVGPKFVDCIVDVGVEKIAARVQGDVEAFIKDNVKAGANEQVYRAAKTFALIAVAGELLIEFKISPWDKDEALTSAKWALEQWIAVRGGTGSSEAKRQFSQDQRAY